MYNDYGYVRHDTPILTRSWLFSFFSRLSPRIMVGPAPRLQRGLRHLPPHRIADLSSALAYLYHHCFTRAAASLVVGFPVCCMAVFLPSATDTQSIQAIFLASWIFFFCFPLQLMGPSSFFLFFLIKLLG